MKKNIVIGECESPPTLFKKKKRMKKEEKRNGRGPNWI